MPIVDNWNNFHVLLVLVIPLPDLETEQLNATIHLAKSLSHQKSIWPGWTISRMSACMRENLSGTFLSVNLLKNVDQSSPNKFLETISQLINRPLKVSINNKKHILKQSHHKHLYTRVQKYDNTGFDGCRNNIDNTFNFFAPKMPVASLGLVNASACTYCQQMFGDGDRAYLIITELYYCNQVIFNESEFTFVGDSIYVPGVRRVFHDLEYDVVVQDSRLFVHVCADKASYVTLGNEAAESVGVRLQLFILIVVIVFLVVVA